MDYFLAIDIGSSNGRHILGYIENDKIVLEEIYRFRNKIHCNKDSSYWDLDYIFEEICNGIKKCKEIEKIPLSIGINSWGTDFVLLDEENKILGNAVSYRDKRTKNKINLFTQEIEKEVIYKKTGIQFLEFNSIYQLYSVDNSIKKNAKTFLMIADYLNFLLTGKKINEYSNATTTQLLNIETKSWDDDLLKILDIDKNIFPELKYPFEKIGNLSPYIEKKVGFQSEVILPLTHDASSAFFASILDEKEGVIINSGTWSLIGTKLSEPLTDRKSLFLNYTNEGGYNKYNFQKNIPGLWIIQEIIRNLDYVYSFQELENFAMECLNFNSAIEVSDKRFFSSDNMIEEIVEYCHETGQKIPINIGEICVAVYRGIVNAYKKSIEEISEIVNLSNKKVNIIGGGCHSKILIDLMKSEIEEEILVGPIEATALGNLIVQMISTNKLKNYEEAKKLIKESL